MFSPGVLKVLEDAFIFPRSSHMQDQTRGSKVANYSENRGINSSLQDHPNHGIWYVAREMELEATFM